MLSYAGIPLFQPTADKLALMAAYLPLSRLNDFARPTWPSRNLTDLPFPFMDQTPPVELNALWWPVGASRWAVGHFLVTEANKQAIEKAVYGAFPMTIGTGAIPYAAQPFTITDGTNTLSTFLYMLPPRPLSQCFQSVPVGGQPLPAWDPDLWVLTLVDDRYHWWLRSKTIDPAAGSTWNQLFESLATGLGITLTIDPIPSAYLAPPVDFMSRYDYLPLLLDAAAYSVGMRVVFNLNATVSVQGPSTAKSSWQSGIGTGFAKIQGGIMLLDGTNASNDVAAAIPANVAVAFPIVRDSFPGCEPYLSNVPVSSLNLPGLSAVPTLSLIDTRYFQSTCAAAYNTSGALVNQTEMDALAKQLASDWVSWQLAPLDFQLMGAIPWPVEGMHDCLWKDQGLPMVRVQRTPWNEWQQQVLHSGTYGSTFYAQISAVIKANSSAKTGNYYDSFVGTNFVASAPAFTSGQPCWLWDASGTATIVSGKEYPGCTLIASFQKRPVYALPVQGSGGGSSSLTVTTPPVGEGAPNYTGPVTVSSVTQINCGFGQTNPPSTMPPGVVEITYSGFLVGAGTGDAIQFASGQLVPWFLAFSDLFAGLTTPFGNFNDYVPDNNGGVYLTYVTFTRPGLYEIKTHVNLGGTGGTFRTVEIQDGFGDVINEQTDTRAPEVGGHTSFDLSTMLLVTVPNEYTAGVYVAHDASGGSVTLTGTFSAQKLG